MAGASPLLQWVGSRLVQPDSSGWVDAVVVLGGAPRYRAPTAARWLQAGRTARVLAVGGRAGSLDEVWRTAAVLRGLGVPEVRVVPLVAPAPGTAEEARVAVGWAQTQGLSSLGVVTSAYHTRRAGFLFRRLADPHGMRIRVIVAEDDPFSLEAWWRQPRARRLVLAEYGKAAWWSLAGRRR